MKLGLKVFRSIAGQHWHSVLTGLNLRSEPGWYYIYFLESAPDWTYRPEGPFLSEADATKHAAGHKPMFR